MRIGILGTGFGKRHAEIFKALPDCEVVGIVGRDQQKTVTIAESLGIPGFTDPNALLRNPEVDAIDVCYPTHLHAEYVIAALNAGKHVLCETPAAYTLEDAEQMAYAAQKNNKLLLIALFDRFQSTYTYVHDYIRAGHLGKPKVVVANRRTPAIWGNLAENIVLNLMIHDIDYLTWLLGSPYAVTARGLKHPTAGWDQVFVSLEFDDVNAMIEGCGIMPVSFPFETQLRVVCERGAIEIDWRFAGEYPTSDVILYPNEGTPQPLTIQDYDPYEAECRHFIRCVQKTADPALHDITAACESLKVALAVKKSLEEQGQRIRL